MDVSTWKSTDGREKEIPVKVAVMIRPLVEKELSRGSRECLEVLSEAEQVGGKREPIFVWTMMVSEWDRMDGCSRVIGSKRI